MGEGALPSLLWVCLQSKGVLSTEFERSLTIELCGGVAQLP